MMIRPYIFLAILPALAIGCAGVQKKDPAMDELNARLSGLNASLEDSRAKFDELNTKFYLLQEKVEASKSEIEQISVLPEAPPEGLKVVSLSEHGDLPPAEPHRAVKKPVAVSVKKPVIAERKPVVEAEKAVIAERKPVMEAEKPVAAAPGPLPEKKQSRFEAKSSLNKNARTPEEMYSHAQQLFLSGRYAEARDAFLALAAGHPDHTLADNAIYWVGEAYYTEKDFINALARFEEVVQRYPAENKAPDALLKAGYSYLEVNDTARGRETLAELVKKYPESDAAGKARSALAGL